MKFNVIGDVSGLYLLINVDIDLLVFNDFEECWVYDDDIL